MLEVLMKQYIARKCGDVMSYVNLIIFDCDGVLLDSQKVINKFEWKYLMDLGFFMSLKQFNEEFSGERALSILERLKKENGFSFQQPLPQLAHEIEDALLGHLSTQKVRPISGIKRLLESLVLKKCVASNCFSKLLFVLLTSSGLLPYFNSHVFSYEEVGPPKPEPDLFLYAAHRMGEPIENCLVIEDSVVGVKAAMAAGISVIGFVGGSHTTLLSGPQLIDAGASHVFKHMKELSLFLKENIPSASI
jgi:HAD superfamily hydrolase (TIGR01509 family)